MYANITLSSFLLQFPLAEGPFCVFFGHPASFIHIAAFIVIVYDLYYFPPVHSKIPRYLDVGAFSFKKTFYYKNHLFTLRLAFYTQASRLLLQQWNFSTTRSSHRYLCLPASMPSRVVSACVFLALLIPSVTSQLAGCADVACPPAATPGGTHECQIGNSTLTSIGVASIDSKISTQPLTWTLGFEWVNETIQDLKYLLHRSLYLGTEPSLNLGDDQSYGGCALIFEGVASMLRFSANTEAKDWTCPNAMGSQCVDDLNLLAQREFENIDKNASASICTALGTVLQDKVPKSCSGVAGSSSWENIISRGMLNMSWPFHSSTC